MFMQPLSNAEISAFNVSQGASKSDPQEAQDRFLKLMVAQLNNQDPLNPLDNAELTSQMAQINTVSGIQQLNATLQGMSQQFQSLQSLQSTSLIGRQAVVEGSVLGYSDDGVAHGGFLLPENAGNVKVHILGQAGQVLDTVDVGARPAGQHWFQWNPGSTDRDSVSGFRVAAQQGDVPIASTPLSRLRVESVGLVEGTVRLRTEGQQAFAYSDVLAFQ
jgi:flagellar basal-body rod modification protein FlgD